MPQPTVWHCGHCHTGPMWSNIDIHCLVCGRNKDDFAADGPVDNPRHLEQRPASLPQPISQPKSTNPQHKLALFGREIEKASWFCGHCHYGPMTDGIDINCVSCGRRKDDYARIDFPQSSTASASSWFTQRSMPPRTKSTASISSRFTQRSKPPPTNSTVSQAEAQVSNYPSPMPRPLRNPNEGVGSLPRNIPIYVRADDSRAEGAEKPFQIYGHRQKEMVVPDSRKHEKDIDMAERIEPASSRLVGDVSQASAVEKSRDFISDETTLESADREKVPRSVIRTKIGRKSAFSLRALERNINDSFQAMGTVERGTKTNKDKALRNYTKAKGKEVLQDSAIEGIAPLINSWRPWTGGEEIDAPPNYEDLFPQAYNLSVEREPPETYNWTAPVSITSDRTNKRTLEDAADVNEPESSILRKSEKRIDRQSHQLRDARSNVYTGWPLWVYIWWPIWVYIGWSIWVHTWWPQLVGAVSPSSVTSSS